MRRQSFICRKLEGKYKLITSLLNCKTNIIYVSIKYWQLLQKPDYPYSKRQKNSTEVAKGIF